MKNRFSALLLFLLAPTLFADPEPSARAKPKAENKPDAVDAIFVNPGARLRSKTEDRTIVIDWLGKGDRCIVTIRDQGKRVFFQVLQREELDEKVPKAYRDAVQLLLAEGQKKKDAAAKEPDPSVLRGGVPDIKTSDLIEKLKSQPTSE